MLQYPLYIYEDPVAPVGMMDLVGLRVFLGILLERV